MGLLSGLGKSLSRGFKKFWTAPDPFTGIGGFFDSTQADIEDAWDDYTGKNIAEKNYELQKNQFEYQKLLNTQQQTREDNAMQRKVADLKAAGLNPVLAANGTGAASAPLKAAPAPQMGDYSGGVREGSAQLAQLFMRTAQMKKEFAVQDKQIQLLQAQKEKADAEAAGIRIDNKYKDRANQANVTSTELDNQLKSGTMQSKIGLEASKYNISKKEELIKNMEMMLGQADYNLKLIDYEIQKLVKEGKITENQILDKKLELLTTECLQKALDYSNSVWDTDWYHARGLPNGFNAGWMGQLALLISGVGEKGANQLIDFFSSLFGDNGNGGSGRENSKDFVWKALKKATSYPSSKNSTWNSIQQTYQDYGVRRNH